MDDLLKEARQLYVDFKYLDFVTTRCKNKLIYSKKHGIIDLVANPKSVETIRQMDVQWEKVGHVGQRRTDIDWSHLKEDYNIVKNIKILAYLYGTKYGAVTNRMKEAKIPYGVRLKSAWNKGLTKETDEGVRRISDFKKRKENNNWMKDHPEEARKFGIRGLQSQGRRTPTRIELKIEEMLQDIGMKFIQQCRIGKYVADFLIKRKIVIECDGDYWHNRPGSKLKDERKNKYYIKKGYKVLRFRECSILNHRTFKEIVRTVQKCMEESRNEIPAIQVV